MLTLKVHDRYDHNFSLPGQHNIYCLVIRRTPEVSLINVASLSPGDSGLVNLV